MSQGHGSHRNSIQEECVNAWLHHSNLSYTSQHPILLHENSDFTHLLVDCHLPPATLIAILSTGYMYYILCLRRLVKLISYQCVTCYRIGKKIH